MMSFQNLYKGLRDFSVNPQVIKTIQNSKRYQPNSEDLSKARMVQLLESRNQRTYLVATNENLYKIIDDRRRNGPKVAWSRSLSSIAPNHQLAVHIEPYKRTIDRLVIDNLPEKQNLVSKKLFRNIELETALKKLVC